ncbi:MAG: hypothetical protein CBE00_01245 [Planctomycetaceae bacterium TMED240]|nr:hypothetical protein [Rhodopirellula sp.]OUX08658.1 MAG: hypothetical protein CBE00_01245 [Planctomycetaceae bacterium TMED240]
MVAADWTCVGSDLFDEADDIVRNDLISQVICFANPFADIGLRWDCSNRAQSFVRKRAIIMCICL